MKIFLTGGTGFVGSEILRQLVAAGHQVTCLVREGSEKKLAVRDKVEIHPGDVTEPDSLEGALEGHEAVIHLVGIIRENPTRGVTFRRLHFEGARNVADAAGSQGVRRMVHMSANGTRENAASPYHQTKWQGEEAVRRSGLEWTIFRPSLIFGPGDEFVNMLARLIRTLPVIPVIGDGRYRMSPVSVKDVAASFVRSLERPHTAGKTFYCCGPVDYSYDEILDLVGRALGKDHVRKIHQPAGLVRPVVTLLDSVPGFPITEAQLTMLLEGNVCDPAPWAQAFDIAPKPFPEGIREYLEDR